MAISMGSRIGKTSLTLSRRLNERLQPSRTPADNPMVIFAALLGYRPDLSCLASRLLKVGSPIGFSALLVASIHRTAHPERSCG